jgi:hypothetical protein
MSLPTKQYPPPGSWEEFESLCADLYELFWKDPGTERHGRQGHALRIGALTEALAA